MVHSAWRSFWNYSQKIDSGLLIGIDRDKDSISLSKKIIIK